MEEKRETENYGERHTKGRVRGRGKVIETEREGEIRERE